MSAKSYRSGKKAPYHCSHAISLPPCPSVLAVSFSQPTVAAIIDEENWGVELGGREETRYRGRTCGGNRQSAKFDNGAGQVLPNSATAYLLCMYHFSSGPRPHGHTGYFAFLSAGRELERWSPESRIVGSFLLLLGMRTSLLRRSGSRNVNYSNGTSTYVLRPA